MSREISNDGFPVDSIDHEADPDGSGSQQYPGSLRKPDDVRRRRGQQPLSLTIEERCALIAQGATMQCKA